MGLTTRQKIPWSYGATSRQPDSWSCGYRVMHGMVAYLKAMENEIFLQPDNLSPTLSATEEDIIQVKERWAPSFFAHARGRLCFIPDGIFFKPQWELDAAWDNNIRPFPERKFSSNWTSYPVVKKVLVGKGRVRTFLRSSRRPQGDRHDPIRTFIVLIKEGVEEDDGEFCDKINNVEDVLYLQCQCSRHHGAMLAPYDFFNGLRPWETFSQPRKASQAARAFYESYVNMTPIQKRVSPRHLSSHP